MSADELRRRREALGLSVGELAHEFRVEASTVWRWENRDGPPRGLSSIGADTVLRRLETEKKRNERTKR
jgi:DNA-binding transcriptional regulator YiaG